MRVLHVINGLGTGGAERSLAEMLPLLRAAGVESTVACLHRKPEGVHAAVQAAGFPVHVVGPGRATGLRRLRSLLGDVGPDLVHTTIFDADVLGRLACAGTSATVLTSLVNTTYDGARLADTSLQPARVRLARAVDALTARHLTHHFHAISAAVRDSAVAHLGVDPRRITVVERGRSLDRLGERDRARRAATRARLGIPDDAEVVLNVGRQEPQKAQAVLLAAVAELAPHRPRLLLLQAGRAGKATPQLQRIVAGGGLQERVRFLGHCDDVGDLLAAADVFAFPSCYEGLGGSVLEAMAVGTPTVVSDAPALLDVVEHGRGGLVVPVGDAPALAGALARMLDDAPLAARLAAQARCIFRRRFTLQTAADRMVALYTGLLAGRVLLRRPMQHASVTPPSHPTITS